MTESLSDIQDSRLLSYVIASGDMRYIPVNERELYLRATPEKGPVIRGEIPGCGVDCHIDLSQVLFEYAVSCEDCKDHFTSAESERRFGEHLGQVFASGISQEMQELPVDDRLLEAMDVILRSANVEFEVDQTAESIRFDLAECPVHRAASEPGYSLRLPVVHLGFAALCDSVVAGLAPGWRMLDPIVQESERPVRSIHFANK